MHAHATYVCMYVWMRIPLEMHRKSAFDNCNITSNLEKLRMLITARYLPMLLTFATWRNVFIKLWWVRVKEREREIQRVEHKCKQTESKNKKNITIARYSINLQSIQYAHANNTRVKSFPLTLWSGWRRVEGAKCCGYAYMYVCVCKCWYVLCLLSNSETKWKNAITIHSIPFNDYSFHFWRCIAIIYWMCKYKCKHPRTYFVMNWWNLRKIEIEKGKNV